jgi:hypothetical protein
MVITAMTPNIDGHLYAETEDEHRNKKLTPLILFIATSDIHGNSSISAMTIVDGKLAMAGKIVRREDQT